MTRRGGYYNRGCPNPECAGLLRPKMETSDLTPPHGGKWATRAKRQVFTRKRTLTRTCDSCRVIFRLEYAFWRNAARNLFVTITFSHIETRLMTTDTVDIGAIAGSEPR